MQCNAKACVSLACSLLELIANAAENELAAIIQHLKEENRILRDKLPKRVQLTDEERQRLVKTGSPLGSAIKEIITIVHYRTFQRWVAATKGSASSSKRTKTGRPKTTAEIGELVIKIATETGWGATRICGELTKLGCGIISRSTVQNILREYNLEPNPKRGPGSWHEFIHRHKDTLYACDFFTKKTWTTSGLVEMYMLVFIHIGSRRIWVSRATASPNSEWVAQQARNMCMEFEDDGIAAHLNHIVSSFVDYYYMHRPHQGLENVPLSGTVPEEQTSVVDPDEVVCKEWLGGVLKHYERRAA